MGVGLHVIGLRDELDSEHVKMIKARDALNEVGIEWIANRFTNFNNKPKEKSDER